MSSEPLTLQILTQGWKQFLAARQDLLARFDKAKAQAKGHEVETFHGRAAEALFREWLGGFLPKRYAVTSGYVISQGANSQTKMPHYDCIIYDALDAPVLWIEDTPDLSTQGRSLAIPCEYVRAVLEVKSRFSSRTVKEAIAHLGDLTALMQGVDAADARYKLHLPAGFFCGIVFFELLKEDERSAAALAEVIQGAVHRNYFGGIVLRAEGGESTETGRLMLTESNTPISSTLDHAHLSLSCGIALTKSMQVEEKHFGAMLQWAEYNFSQFAFDLLAMLQGTYTINRVSSYHAFGSSLLEQTFLAMQQEAKAKPQNSN